MSHRGRGQFKRKLHPIPLILVMVEGGDWLPVPAALKTLTPRGPEGGAGLPQQLISHITVSHRYETVTRVVRQDSAVY